MKNPDIFFIKLRERKNLGSTLLMARRIDLILKSMTIIYFFQITRHSGDG